MVRKPYLIFVGDASRSAVTKTAEGVRDWAREDCTGQWRQSPGATDLGLPDMAPAEAYAAGARSLLIGIAAIGGRIPDEWVPLLLEALEAGLDIVSGMHGRLSAIPEVAEAAARLGRSLHDVRHSSRSFPVASGRKRSGKRLLTVGTDCALGKKYTALALAAAMKERGVDADFRATGQTGIMISGDGVAIDAVVADFIAGAAETLSPEAAPGHWDVIEGQGAIFHPAYAGVTLGLLHGSQPDALVLCHDPRRTEISMFEGFPIRPLEETMETYLSLARVTNPDARFVGISLNTSGLSEVEANALAASLEAQHGLPVMDPLRFGTERVVEQALA
ncbi:DUF1611 domain-containing protein [Sandaracinobacter neustonicus]|uniref:DUF1611 domain-containing protein n=1 Tax=Sandaracinobacter neustonicus TaxID=1715348 RepID=A0A501XST1_9SPHN|nr:DUF1611 domain-containing protein [Sandaracinobacter neustonicus]TPE63731.1 DUF1611 domain-containing protein [Sandaracinobacter neustonicus]